MTYFPDLTPYTYTPSGDAALNIGWLDKDHPYTTGDYPLGLIDRLEEVGKNPVNMCRGMHFCELCPDFSTARTNTSRNGIFIASGEIRINGKLGLYAAPTMIIHYIEAHSYLPPRDFCEALHGNMARE